MKSRLLTILALVLTLLGIVLLAPQAANVVQSGGPPNTVMARALDIEAGRVQRGAHEQLLSSGTMYALLQASGALDVRANQPSSRPSAPSGHESRAHTQGCQNVFNGPNGLRNVRVNQDCSLRRQAEEVIVANPNNPNNLIAGQNDSRVGFNHCGYDWSFDGGKTWGDQIPPFYQFILADGHTADACSDPGATFDADGNAYVDGILFDVNFGSSALVVEKSNVGIGGAFYHSPKVQPFQTYRDTPVGAVANETDPNLFDDKPLIVADAGKTSPKKNNVYDTWTLFNAATGAGVGANSPIVFSQSTDGGATWSPRIEISGKNGAICSAFSGETSPAACDQDQGSHPVVGKDGTLYVSFNNGNTVGVGIQQQLFVKCPASMNCASAASWTAPVKIADDIATQPVGPNASTACAGGRQCIPTNGYRIDDFGALAVDDSGKLYFTWSDYRNGGGTCAPLSSAATATPPCDNDVFYSYSTNGGSTWSAPFNIAPKSKVGANAQWQAWGAVTADGKTYFVAYYDRSYGNCETTGCNDITLASIKEAATASPDVNLRRITTSSMPNLVVANDPIEAGFLGDYMWVSVDSHGRPLVVWADTRGLDGAVEEDIYMAQFGEDEHGD